MNADGSNVTPLTSDDNDTNISPVWAPRKTGRTVTAASLVIPNTASLQPMSVTDLVVKEQATVVRIVTDLGSGSGVIVSPDGTILTANHVIKDAKTITVYLDGGDSYTATVLSRDLVRDIALVKIDATGLQYAELGDVGSVPLGSDVVVMGYPLGSADLNVTKGSVSSFKTEPSRNVYWIQTDATVNFGNSGGPIFNLQGQAVGIVTLKAVGTGVEGTAFAVSSNTINQYIGALKAGQTTLF